MHRTRLSRLSVPSSSGKYSSTAGMRPSVAGIRHFQSPLHRGSTLQPQYGETPYALGQQLSVPSSSGKSLQPLPGAACQQRRLPFSPLFIGEVSSTLPGTSRGIDCAMLSVPSSSGNSLQQRAQLHRVERAFAFQSPLHRGSTLQRQRASPAAARLLTFSPLFIGEVSSTRLARCIRRMVIALALSVPSSSGKSLQPTACW